MIDMRDAFFNSICEEANLDKSIIILSDDHAAFSLDKFAKEFPDQYINVGISEQNIINLAAGMALEGYKPFVYGISSFITGRCFEQINIQLSAMNLSVVLIGVGAGFTYSVDGPTHHGLQDIALINSMPNMTILDSSDPISTTKFAKISCFMTGPVYVRIEKGIFPELYISDYDFLEGAAELIESNNILVVASGFLVHKLLELVRSISGVGLLDLYRIKPLNSDYILKVIKKYKTVIVAEEQFSGGVGSIIAALMATNNIFKPFINMNVKKYCFYYSSCRDEVMDKCGIGILDIEKKIRECIIE